MDISLYSIAKMAFVASVGFYSGKFVIKILTELILSFLLDLVRGLIARRDEQ